MLPALLPVHAIDDSGRHHVGTAENEVGHITHTGSHRSFRHQMHQDLYQLREHPCHRSHGKGSYQHRDF